MDTKQDVLASVLSRPEIQESLAAALEKLPSVMAHYSAIETMLEFAAQVMQDKESMQYLLQGFADDLPTVKLDRETLEAGIILLGKMPKVVKYFGLAEQLIDTVEAVVTDKESVRYLVNGMQEFIEPFVRKVENGRSVWEEAQVRAASDRSPVSFLALLKMLKEPQVQKGVHLAKALLTVSQERAAGSSPT